MNQPAFSKLLGPVLAVMLVVGVIAAPAAYAHKIKRGSYFCSQTSATINILKNNRYKVNGENKGKYVHRAGTNRVRFITGVYAPDDDWKWRGVHGTTSSGRQRIILQLKMPGYDWNNEYASCEYDPNA